MSPIKFIFLIVFTLLAVVLAVKNMHSVELSYYSVSFAADNKSISLKTIHAPLLIVILVSLGAGYFIAWVGGWIQQLKLKALLRHKEKELLSIQAQLDALKPPSAPVLPSDVPLENRD